MKQAFTPDLSLSLSLPKFGITKLMRLQKWGEYPTKFTTTFAFFYSFSSILLLWNRSVSFRCCLFQKALQDPPNGISRSFAVHISYIKSKDASPFTFHKFPSSTLTQPPASVSCRVPSTCGSTTRNLQLSPRTNGRTTEFPCDRIAPHPPLRR